MVLISRIFLRNLSLILIYFLSIPIVNSQVTNPSKNTIEINRKLKELSQPNKELPGGYSFDNTYEGIKGGPCLFEKLIPLLIKVNGVDYYIRLEANLDLRNNTLLYTEKESGQLFSIPCQRIAEVVVEMGDDILIYRTTEYKNFKKDLREVKFIQVLRETPNEFIKIPIKVYVPADYQGGYSAKRRYDEYKTEYKYYIMRSDNVYTEIKLNRKSLIKLFPYKRETINNAFKEKSFPDKEEIVLSVLEKL